MSAVQPLRSRVKERGEHKHTGWSRLSGSRTGPALDALDCIRISIVGLRSPIKDGAQKHR